MRLKGRNPGNCAGWLTVPAPLSNNPTTLLLMNPTRPRSKPAWKQKAPRPAPPSARDLKAEFDSLIPHRRPLLSVLEMREAFGVCVQQVHNWIDSGEVAAGDIGCGARRKYLKITRASASAFYARRFGWDAG